MSSLIWVLLIGACAGWLAGQFVKGSSFGLVMNVIIGVIGAAVGGVLFRVLGLSAQGLIGEIIMATAGAVVLLLAVRQIKKV